jgi:hypothetical protein
MKTYNLELRHAASKRRLNASPGNRLEPLKSRQPDDAAAIAWARAELLGFGMKRGGTDYQYVEGALAELLPFNQIQGDKDMRRLGRWVCNADGITWRDAAGAVQD